jgi:hypothetical protein
MRSGDCSWQRSAKDTKPGSQTASVNPTTGNAMLTERVSTCIGVIYAINSVLGNVGLFGRLWVISIFEARLPVPISCRGV